MIPTSRKRLGERILRESSRLCVVIGAILIVIFLYDWVDARAYQVRYARHFDSFERSENAAPSAQSSQPPQAGSAIGKIQVPRLGLSVVVLEGDDGRTLRLGAGHIPGTALLGQRGNAVVAAHRDTFFRPLHLVQSGDLIRVLTEHGSYNYRVELTEVVSPDDVRVLEPTTEPTLTLVTCYPFFYVGPAPQRYVVRALLLGNS